MPSGVYDRTKSKKKKKSVKKKIKTSINAKTKKKPGPKPGWKKKKKETLTESEAKEMIEKAELNKLRPVLTIKDVTIKVWEEKYSEEEAKEIYSCVERLCRIIGPQMYEDLISTITLESGIKQTSIIAKTTEVRSEFR